MHSFFWRVGNNKHKWFERTCFLIWTWGQYVTALDLINPIGSSGENLPHPYQFHAFIFNAWLFQHCLPHGNVLFSSQISSDSGTCQFPPFVGDLLWVPDPRVRGNVVQCRHPPEALGALCWVPPSSPQRLSRAPSLGSLWERMVRLDFGCPFNGYEIFAEFRYLSNLKALAVNLKMRISNAPLKSLRIIHMQQFKCTELEDTRLNTHTLIKERRNRNAGPSLLLLIRKGNQDPELGRHCDLSEARSMGLLWRQAAPCWLENLPVSLPSKWVAVPWDCTR